MSKSHLLKHNRWVSQIISKAPTNAAAHVSYADLYWCPIRVRIAKGGVLPTGGGDDATAANGDADPPADGADAPAGRHGDNPAGCICDALARGADGPSAGSDGAKHSPGPPPI